MEKLAIEGGKPLNQKAFPPDFPKADIEDIKAIEASLRSKQLTVFDSSEVVEFEREFASYTDAQYCTMMTNCTSVIACALMINRDVHKNEVILPAYTYAATAMAVKAIGFVPVFADVELETYNISPSEIRKLVTSKTCAVIGVHLFGSPCNISEIMKLGTEFNFKLIEDCAQATGASFKKRKVGSFGIGCHSFGENKILRIGEGGALTTNDPVVDRFSKIVRHEGEIWSKTGNSAVSLEGITYQDFVYGFDYSTIGFNFRPLSYQAAFARSRLKKIDKELYVRRRNSAYLISKLEKIDGIATPKLYESAESSWFSLVIRVNQEFDRDSILLPLIMEGIPAGVHYPRSLPSFEVFQSATKYGYPNTELLCQKQIALPVYPGLSTQHMQLIVNGLEKVLRRLSENPIGIRKIVRKQAQIMKIKDAYTGLYMIP